MLLLRVFLLVMLIRGSSGQETPLPVEDCEKRACFIPKICMKTDTLLTTLEYASEDNAKIFSNCDGFAKIRAYSPKYYLVVLETNWKRIKWIKLEQGTTSMQCEKQGNKATIKTSDELTGTLIKHESNPLMCEFFVKKKTDDAIFDGTTVVKLTTDTSAEGFTAPALMISLYTQEMFACDPDAVKSAQLGAVDDKTVSEVDVKLDELVCPTGQRMAFRKDQQSAFEAAPNGKITCEKVSSTYQFKPTLIEARCEVTTCKQCNLNTLGSKGFEILDEGGCKKLKCKEGMRVKFGTSNPEDGMGECKYENNKHVWKFNGKTIEDSTDVKCAEKLKCFSSQEDVEKVCENCILGLNNLPVCKSETAVLKYGGSVKMDVQCDDITGKILFNSEPITLSKKLKCVDDKEEKAAEIAKKADEAAQQGTIIGASIGCVVGIAIIAGIVVFVVLRRKKQKAKKEEEEDEKKWKMKNALEQVKSGKSEKSWAKQHEELQRQQMNAPTEQMDEETRFGGDTGTKPTQKSSKKKRSKKDDTDPCYAGASAGPVIPHRDDDETGATGIDSVVIMPGPRKG